MKKEWYVKIALNATKEAMKDLVDDKQFYKELGEMLTEEAAIGKFKAVGIVNNEELREQSCLLYCLLADELQKQNPENVPSRIEFLTQRSQAEFAEFWKAFNFNKGHDFYIVRKTEWDKMVSGVKQIIIERKKEMVEKIKNWANSHCTIYYKDNDVGVDIAQINEFLDSLLSDEETNNERN